MDNELTRYMMMVGAAGLATFFTLTLVLDPNSYDGWRGPVGAVADIALVVGTLFVAGAIVGQVVMIIRKARS